MIVFGDWVIVTPARCASYALENHLKRHGGRRVQLPEGRHTGVIPERFSDLQKLIVVRNPYRRIESLFRLMTDSMFWAGRSSYEEWAKKAMINLPTCTATHHQCKPAKFVRVEQLQEGLVSAGFPSELSNVPRFHESRSNPETKITPEIREWAKPDLWYGYTEE